MYTYYIRYYSNKFKKFQTYWLKAKDDEAAKKQLKKQFPSATNISIVERTENNPSSTREQSEEVSRLFHGREPREILELVEEEHYDKNLGVLGQLLELNILRDDEHSIVPIIFCKLNGNARPSIPLEEMVQVCSAKMGNADIQFKGGEQELDLHKLFEKGLYSGEATFNKQWCIVGPVYSIVYWADKHHLEETHKNKKKEGAWEHEFTTEGDLVDDKDAEYPILVYDTKNKRIFFSGGTYTVEEEGIKG